MATTTCVQMVPNKYAVLKPVRRAHDPEQAATARQQAEGRAALADRRR